MLIIVFTLEILTKTQNFGILELQETPTDFWLNDIMSLCMLCISINYILSLFYTMNLRQEIDHPLRGEQLEFIPCGQKTPKIR